MNATPNIERRRHPDTAARITYATCTVRGNCELARVGSKNHADMLRFGFSEIDRDGENVLLLPPAGWTN